MPIAKPSVRIGNLKSVPFSSNIRVRQGENLSPILLSLFLNNLSEFIAHSYNGLNSVSDMAHTLLNNDNVEVYFNLYIRLYGI